MKAKQEWYLSSECLEWGPYSSLRQAALAYVYLQEHATDEKFQPVDPPGASIRDAQGRTYLAVGGDLPEWENALSEVLDAAM